MEVSERSRMGEQEELDVEEPAFEVQRRRDEGGGRSCEQLEANHHLHPWVHATQVQAGAKSPKG